MAKTIKAKSDFGINTIMDSIMVPDGFSRVCDGLDIRSGVARPWQAPSTFRPLGDSATKCIWEYRGTWHESKLLRTYHGEFLEGQEAVYFTEEGPEHLPPQKIVNGIQVRLGTRRPLGSPVVTASNNRYPTSISTSATMAGGVPPGAASYRIAGIKDGNILNPSGPVKIQITMTTGSTVVITWSQISGVDGYAIFGRTSGSERLLVMLTNVSSWTDNGTRAEGNQLASAYDTVQAYQYVYTYYRTIGTVTDESGPSSISDASDPSKICTVSRSMLTDGFYQEGTTIFSTASTPLTAWAQAGSHISVVSAYAHPDGSLTMFTTATAHGLVTGAEGNLTGSNISPSVASVLYTINVPVVLSNPTFSLNPVNPAGGTLSVGSHSYQVVGVRGSTDGTVGNPAQTLSATLSTTVVGGNQTVIVNLLTYSNGTDAFIIYRDGVAVHVAPITVASWTDDGSATALTGVTYPAVNETSTRCFAVASMAFVVSGSGVFFNIAATELLMPLATSFAPNVTTTNDVVTGDVIYLSGLTTMPELNGASMVIAYNPVNGHVTIDRVLSATDGTTDSSGAQLYWRPFNGYYTGWRLYRVGDTAEFLLTADLPLETTSFLDDTGVASLGAAIPTAYTENGLYVVYDRAPEQLRRMVTHYGMRFGIVDNVVRWTPNNKPDAWPDVYNQTFPSQPVAIVPFMQKLCVVCEDGLYGLIGNTASTLSPAGPFSNLGCIAPFTLVPSNHGLMWLSKVGIVYSPDGMSARCVSQERVPGRYLYAPSTQFSTSPIGGGWWLPPTQSVQFAESMREESIDASLFPVTQVTNDLPIIGEMTDVRGFFWDNRYFIYYSGTDAHARSAMVTIDMSRAEMPMSTLPVKPIHVHISTAGDCYMLLDHIVWDGWGNMHYGTATWGTAIDVES